MITQLIESTTNSTEVKFVVAMRLKYKKTNEFINWYLLIDLCRRRVLDCTSFWPTNAKKLKIIAGNYYYYIISSCFDKIRRYGQFCKWKLSNFTILQIIKYELFQCYGFQCKILRQKFISPSAQSPRFYEFVKFLH